MALPAKGALQDEGPFVVLVGNLFGAAGDGTQGIPSLVIALSGSLIVNLRVPHQS